MVAGEDSGAMALHDDPRHECVLALLEECGLPTGDLRGREVAAFICCGEPARPAGVAGLEAHGAYGLLRSLAVAARARGAGCGRALVAGIEARARARGVQGLYLLTETAEPFFEGLGYRRVPRHAVPEVVRRTSEFTSLCPDSAAVMCKALEPCRVPHGPGRHAGDAP